MGKSAILSVKIIGDASSAVAALNRAQKASHAFSLKNSAVFGAVAGGVGKAVGMAIDYVTNLTSEMMSASDSTDKFKQTLNFAGLDTKTIDRLAKSTQAYADKTVYDLGDIRNATAQLAANNVKNFDKIAEAAGNLNAVAGGTAETYGRLATAVVQVNAANKLQTQDWNQIRDAVPGASGKIKQALLDAGAYTGDFSQALSKGQISAEEFNNALINLGMTDAAKQAAESTATFEGAAGNFEAAVVKAGTAVLDMVKPFATPAISQAADAISDFSSHINAEEISKGAAAVKDFADGVEQVTGFVMPFVIAIGLAVTSIQSMYAVMAAGGIIQWITSLNIITTATTAWTTAINMARDAQAMFNIVMEANPIGVIITLIAAITAGLVYFFTQTKVGQQAWAAFTQFMGNAFSNIGAWASGAWDGIVKGIKAMAIVVSSVAGGFLLPFRMAFEAIRALWNSTIGGKGFDVPGWIPGIGGKSFKIPMLANGGVIRAAGTVLVGERGPEFLTLPAGAQVTPLSRARYNVNGDGSSGPVFNITVNGALDPEGVAATVLEALKKYERNRS